MSVINLQYSFGKLIQDHNDEDHKIYIMTVKVQIILFDKRTEKAGII